MNEKVKQSIIEIRKQYTVTRSLEMHTVRWDVPFPVDRRRVRASGAQRVPGVLGVRAPSGMPVVGANVRERRHERSAGVSGVRAPERLPAGRNRERAGRDHRPPGGAEVRARERRPVERGHLSRHRLPRSTGLFTVPWDAATSEAAATRSVCNTRTTTGVRGTRERAAPPRPTAKPRAWSTRWTTVVRGTRIYAATPLPSGAWSVCDTRTSTGARGTRTCAIAPRTTGTWNASCTHRTTVTRGPRPRARRPPRRSASSALEARPRRSLFVMTRLLQGLFHSKIRNRSLLCAGDVPDVTFKSNFDQLLCFIRVAPLNFYWWQHIYVYIYLFIC
jgi:hypothetical protein